jgi:hypothetical protein
MADARTKNSLKQDMPAAHDKNHQNHHRRQRASDNLWANDFHRAITQVPEAGSKPDAVPSAVVGSLKRQIVKENKA